ncbi:MAG: SPFH domain-containing protein [Christensenellales bacterium]|jgi:membrane protease subunit HflK
MKEKRNCFYAAAYVIGLGLISIYISGQVWQDAYEMYSLTLDYMYRLLRLLAVIGGGFLLGIIAKRIKGLGRLIVQGVLAGLVLWQCIISALLPFNLFSPASALEMKKDIYIFSVEHLLIFLLLLAMGFGAIKQTANIKLGDETGIFKLLSPVALAIGLIGLLVFLGNEIPLPTAFIANLLLSVVLVYMFGVVLYGLWQWGSKQLRQSFDASPPKAKKPKQASDASWKPRLSFQSLYSIHLVKKLLPWMGLLMLACLLVSSAVYTVQPHERALLYRFGMLQKNQGSSPGIHLKYPWPIDELRIIDTQRVRSMSIGYTASESEDFLWTSRHGGEEPAFLLGGGNELAAINLRVHYHISHPDDFVHQFNSPEDMLAAKAYELLMSHTAGTDLNHLLSINRKDFSQQLHDRLTDYANLKRLGLAVDTVIVESLHPPVDVAHVYQDVINAGLRKTAMVTQAQGEAAACIHAAQSQKEAAILEAQGKKAQEISNAKKQHLGVLAAMEGSQDQPEVLQLMRWIKAYQHLLDWERVYVFSPRTLNQMDRFVLPLGTSPVLIQHNKETVKE